VTDYYEVLGITRTATDDERRRGGITPTAMAEIRRPRLSSRK
jgi:hypothetical protein